MSDAVSVMRAGVSFNVGMLPISTKSSVCQIELPLGEPVPPETHDYNEQVLIIDGEGVFQFGDSHPYRPGDMFLVPAGIEHQFVQIISHTVFLRLVTRSPKVLVAI